MARLRLLSSLVVLLLVVGACVESDGDVTGTSSEPVTVSVEELEAARAGAANNLLESAGIEAVARSYGEDRQLSRIAWTDYRSNGDYAAVFYIFDEAASVEEPSEVLAIIQKGETELEARVGAGGQGTWAPASPADFEPFADRRPGRLPVGLDLQEMASAPVLEDIPYDEAVATRQVLADGIEIWTLTISRTVAGEEVSTVLTYEIAPDGRLEYILETETGITDPRTEYEIVPIQEPEPIALPDVGEPLDLDLLGVPESLPPKP